VFLLHYVHTHYLLTRKPTPTPVELKIAGYNKDGQKEKHALTIYVNEWDNPTQHPKVIKATEKLRKLYLKFETPVGPVEDF